MKFANWFSELFKQVQFQQRAFICVQVDMIELVQFIMKMLKIFIVD